MAVRKASLKTWIHAASNFIALIPSWFVKCWQIFLELILKECPLQFKPEKESRCLVFMSLTKREIRHFHIAVMQRATTAKKCTNSVMHVQSGCFANLNQPSAFWHLATFRCCFRRCLSPPTPFAKTERMHVSAFVLLNKEFLLISRSKS